MCARIETCKICFIGGGSMAAAIIGGLITRNLPASNMSVAEPLEASRDKLQSLYDVAVTASNAAASQEAELVVLAVKPQVARSVCQELGAAWAGRKTLPLVVSIAAGITADSLSRWFEAAGRRPKLVRVIPNTPALVGEGASGVFAGPDVGEAERDLVTGLLRSFGKVTEWVDEESLLDVVTGLSGSGPAYFFAMVEHLVASATALGLSHEQATRLVKQTCFGAGKMLVESSDDPAQLRGNVTSPNGTTYAALQSLEASGFRKIVDQAVKAATMRGAELGKDLGEQ